MSKNFVASFKKLGAPLASPRADWSGVSADGKTVAISIWRDELDNSIPGSPILDCRQHKDISVWAEFPGNKKRKAHIEHALSSTDGIFKIVMLRAKDPEKLPREIDEAWIWKGMIGKITDYDPNTGGFRAEFIKDKGTD